MNPNLTANLRAESELRAEIEKQKQTFTNWQQNPMQGAIPMQSPFTLADESYLIETLTDCRVRLEAALRTAQGYNRLPDLATAISDAITAIHKAEAVVIDPQTYLE